MEASPTSSRRNLNFDKKSCHTTYQPKSMKSSTQTIVATMTSTVSPTLCHILNEDQHKEAKIRRLFSPLGQNYSSDSRLVVHKDGRARKENIANSLLVCSVWRRLAAVSLSQDVAADRLRKSRQTQDKEWHQQTPTATKRVIKSWHCALHNCGGCCELKQSRDDTETMALALYHSATRLTSRTDSTRVYVACTSPFVLYGDVHANSTSRRHVGNVYLLIYADVTAASR